MCLHLKSYDPALVVVAVLGVLRGFFQGLGTMMPSAISQIIEQIVNAIISVWAAYVLYRYGTRIGAVLGDAEHYGPAYGAAGGTLGTNLGSVAALIFVLFVFFAYMHVFKRRMRREKGVKVEPFAYTMKILIITIVPVLLSTTVYNISSIIDQSIFKNVALLQGYSENKIDVWWGVFSGKYKLLINVPISIASAMAAILRADTDDVLCTERYEKSQGTDQFCHAFYHGDFFPLCHRTCCIGRADLSSAFPGNGTDGTYGRYHDVGWGNGGCVLCNVYAFKRTAAGH